MEHPVSHVKLNTLYSVLNEASYIQSLKKHPVSLIWWNTLYTVFDETPYIPY